MSDHPVFIFSDATAMVNGELHLATLKNLAFAFAHVLDTESLCWYLEGNPPDIKFFRYLASLDLHGLHRYTNFYA